MGSFVHLHNHTEYSLLDGVARIKQLCKACKNKGMDTLAITDHGNMFGIIYFAEECVKNGIKPIIGCEMYMVDDYTVKERGYDHLILLCKNDIGYKNLVKLDSIAYVDGLYYKPRMDYKTLKEHSEGLVCLSGCLQGRVTRRMAEGDYEGAKQAAIMLKEMFGEDFYIELQDHGIDREKAAIPGLIKLARELDIKVCATNDVHYIEKEDMELQDVALCIGEKTTLSDNQRKMRAYENTYLKTPEEMAELFSYCPEAISNTLEIANKCSGEIIKLKVKRDKETDKIKSVEPVKDESLIPGYVPENGQTPKEFLRALTEEGLIRKYGEITPEIKERYEMELGVIDYMGFNEYFLIVWDFIFYAKSVGIPVGPGRGSGAGSIVAYAVGITDVDPLKFSLFFERFLNKERVSMPDFDIDFSDERREEIVEYVRKKYGESNVCQIITFGTLASKAAIKDVARVFDVPFADVNAVTKLMDAKYSIRENLGFDEHRMDDGKMENVGVKDLIDIYNTNPLIKRVMDIAIKLENIPRNTSKHAAGVIICRYPLADHVPLQKGGDSIVTTQFDKKLVEQVGLLKMDFLGLITLNDLQKAHQYIKERHGVTIDFKQIGYDDPEVYKYISDGETMAVFQLEQPGMTKFMTGLKPTTFEDIIAGISLYRPGPMDSIPDYIRAKNHPETIHYLHPSLEPILKDTYGCIVYQEQVMSIVQVLGGFSLGEADNVRRAMSKKDQKAMVSARKQFLENSKTRGVSEEVATQIFNQMDKFASYAFNKSHATAYAVLSYQTAYVKMHYHNEFMTAILNNRINKIDEISRYLSYLKSKNVPIFQPDVNKSKKDFSCEENGIRVGLSALKNVGEGAVINIIEERERNGEFKSFEDFVNRTVNSGLNRRMLESLILSGAFDSFNHYRSQYMAICDSVLDEAVRRQKESSQMQISMFGTLVQEDFGSNVKYPETNEFDSKTKLLKEKSVLGVYVTGHPLNDYREKLENASFTTAYLGYYTENEQGEKIYTDMVDGQSVTFIGIISELRKIVSKKNPNSQMMVATIEDLYGSIECSLFSQVAERYKNQIAEDDVVQLNGKLRIKEGYVNIIVDSIEKIQEINDIKEEVEPDYRDYLIINVTKEQSEKQENILDNILDVLDCYPGDIEVYINFVGKMKKASIKVRNCEGILMELYSLVGVNNVEIKRVANKK